MDMEEITKLYQHIRLDTEEIFYFGIGMDDRPWVVGGRNIHWRRIVKKHGYRVEVLEEGLSWYQACELEKMLIALHGRRDLGTGPLVNMTDGGDGVAGKVVSPETRAKISASQTGKTKGKKKPPFTAKHKANMSAAITAWHAAKKLAK
jgi:hypothetical protein